MKIITVNLPEKYIKAFEELQAMGKYPNRSVAIRKALKQYLEEELHFSQDLEDPEVYEIIDEVTPKC